MASAFTIRAATAADMPALIAYLGDQLTDNGSGETPLFMPIARGEAGFPPEKQASMRDGLALPVGQSGWRKPWIAFTQDGAIAGHVDLRARPEKASAHRALLGMGVHRAHRKQGLGALLVQVACNWARSQDIAWIDLDVLSVNRTAIALYERCGFTHVGEMPDMFRIDGQSYGHTFMTRAIA